MSPQTDNDLGREVRAAMMRRDFGAAAHALKLWLQVEPGNSEAEQGLQRIWDKFEFDARAAIKEMGEALDSGEMEKLANLVANLDRSHPEWTAFLDREETLARAREAMRVQASPSKMLPAPEFDERLRAALELAVNEDYEAAAEAAAQLRERAEPQRLKGEAWERLEFAATAADLRAARVRDDESGAGEALREFDRLSRASRIQPDARVREIVEEAKRWLSERRTQRKFQAELREARLLIRSWNVRRLAECRRALSQRLVVARAQKGEEVLETTLEQVIQEIDSRCGELRQNRIIIAAVTLIAAVAGVLICFIVKPPALFGAAQSQSRPRSAVNEAPNPTEPARPAAEACNPQPKADDFVLPLPNGGELAFRRVKLGVGSAPGTPPVLETPSLAGPMLRVRGPFAEDGDRLYYIGKYEVSIAQFQSVMGGLSADDASLPVTNISLDQAQEFCRSLTRWLAATQPDRLPHPAGSQVAARIDLPTRDQWEFAARGGAAGKQAGAFSRAAHPYGNEPLSRFEWFGGSSSSFGKVHAIGRLAPNPLGIHDMLGNVKEMTCSKADAGPVRSANTVMRGGDYLTPESKLGAGAEEEQPDLSPISQQPFRQPELGFRVVITAEPDAVERVTSSR